jgi:hypothetical protein
MAAAEPKLDRLETALQQGFGLVGGGFGRHQAKPVDVVGGDRSKAGA